MPPDPGGTGNIFRGCRAWWNSDDGWDFINAGEACTVEYSWAWYARLQAGRPQQWRRRCRCRPGTATVSRPAATAFRRPTFPKSHSAARHPVQRGVLQQGRRACTRTTTSSRRIFTTTPRSTTASTSTCSDWTATSGDVGRHPPEQHRLRQQRDALTADMDNGGPISDMFNSWDTGPGREGQRRRIPERGLQAAGVVPRRVPPGWNALLSPGRHDLLRRDGQRASGGRQPAGAPVPAPGRRQRPHRQRNQPGVQLRGCGAGSGCFRIWRERRR